MKKIINPELAHIERETDRKRGQFVIDIQVSTNETFGFMFT